MAYWSFLENGISMNTRKQAGKSVKTRAASLEEKVAKRTASLRKLADHQEMVREEEKRAIAKELHDNMGALLTSLSLRLEEVYVLFPGDPEWTARKTMIQSLVCSAVNITRRIQTELRPAMLDIFGIKAAIHEQLDDFSARTGIVCNASLPDEHVILGQRLEITVYRMLQESLNNVMRHANASQIDVIVDVDEDRVAVTVRDNGIGIAPGRLDDPDAYGLRGLHERATFLGGKLTVSANKNKGTTVAIELPILPCPDA